MARPKEFDPEDALHAAMRAFWEHGYEHTSFSDLTKCTGVQKASLYGTFGDKRALFLAALERYHDERFDELAARLAVGSSARAILHGLLREKLDSSRGTDGCGKSCLWVNTVVEFAPHDAEVTQRLTRHVQRTQRLLEALFERGRESGELRADLDPALSASLLLCTMWGLSLYARTGANPQRLIGVFDELLVSFEARR
jgi:TetR/AcrR family transcriptional regulator, transcriptional repressor for nem operon